MKEHLDVLGMPLEVGDIIAFAESAYGNGYRIDYGKIIGFTEKFIKISHLDSDRQCGRKAYDKVIKITAQHKWNKENHPEYFL